MRPSLRAWPITLTAWVCLAAAYDLSQGSHILPQDEFTPIGPDCLVQ